MDPKTQADGDTLKRLFDDLAMMRPPHWPTLKRHGWRRVPTATTGGKPWFFTKRFHATGELITMAWDRRLERWRFTIDP